MLSPTLRGWLPLSCILVVVGAAKIYLLLATDVGSNLLVADEYTNLDYANSMIANLTYHSRDGMAYRPPVYSVILAVVKLMVGNKVAYYKFLNILLSLFTIIVLYVSLPQKWRLFAALALAVYPTYFFLYELVLSENLAILWVALIVLNLQRSHGRAKLQTIVLQGVLSGLLVLTRPESLGYLVLLHIWLIVKVTKNFSYSLLIMLVFINSWLVRNYLVLGKFPILSTNGANTFYLATFPESTGTGIYSTDDLKQFPTFARDLEAMRSLSELERYEYYIRQGKSYLLANPSKFIQMWPIRQRTLLAPEFAVPGRLIRAGRFNLSRQHLGYYLILVSVWESILFAAIAVQVLRQRFEFTYLVFLIGLIGVVSVVIAEARFKIQIMPALLAGLSLSFARHQSKSSAVKLKSEQ